MVCAGEYIGGQRVRFSLLLNLPVGGKRNFLTERAVFMNLEVAVLREKDLTLNKLDLCFVFSWLLIQAKACRLAYFHVNTRRQFLFDCSAVGAAVLLSPWSVFASPETFAGNYWLVEQLSYEMFAAHVNTPFRVRRANGHTVKLELVKVHLACLKPSAHGRLQAGNAGYEQFSLIFRGPKETPLTSAIHHFAHNQLGRFDMYIGRIGTDIPDLRYEAVFNRPANLPAGKLKANTSDNKNV